MRPPDRTWNAPWRSTEKALGPDHPDTATSLNNLGFLLDSMGDYGRRRDRTTNVPWRSLKRRWGQTTPTPPAASTTWAGYSEEMGDYAAARPYGERALAIREKALGPDHPDTARSLNNLGTLCFYEGDLPASAAYLRQALRIWEKRLGPNHPDTQTAKNNLAFVEAQLQAGKSH